jgi:hypothetical protein
MHRPWSRLALVLLTLASGVSRVLAAEPAGARLVGPFPKDEYPQALIDRPLTLPAGMIEGELGWSFVSRPFDPSILGVTGADEWLMDVALRVGVTDRIQVEVGTAFSLDYSQRTPNRSSPVHGFDPPDIRPSRASWQHVVPLRLSGLALDTDTLDTAVTLTLPFTANADREIFFGRSYHRSRNGDGRVLPSVDLAAPTRWRLTDWVWLRAGENLFQVTTGDVAATFAFDLGVGVQPHRIFAVTLDSRIADITFDGDGEEPSQTLADVGTIDLEGTLAPIPGFDLVGSLGLPDVGRGFDEWVTRFGIRVRL